MLARVLTTIVALGVVIAGIVLWHVATSRAGWIRHARWAVAALAAYGALSFAYAAAIGIPVHDALQGYGLFEFLPYVLQGVFIGGFVVLPLGWVWSILSSGISQFRQGSTRPKWYQAVALTASVALLIASLPKSSRDVAASAPQSLPEPVPMAASQIDPVLLLKRANEIEASFAAVEWDLDTKAETLENGIDAAFVFVRDSIHYEPYSGVLRGAGGTYSARAGNAVDRALLLQHLLARQGIPTRFALGTLPEDACKRLFARTFERSTTLRTRPRTPVSTSSSSDSLYKRIFARANRDFDLARKALGNRLPLVTKPTREQALAWMNPHVWIQAEVKNEWIDLDPSFPDTSAGTALTSPDRVVSELPPDLFQRISTRVIAERMVGNATVSSTALELTRNAVDLVDRPVFLLHTKGRPNAFGGLGSALTATLGGGDQWVPALWIGGEFSFGRSITVSSPEFVAEWLEFEVSWPDGRRETTRRPLLDRAGAAWRASKSFKVEALQQLDGDEAGPYTMQAVHNVWFSSGSHNLAQFAAAVQATVEDGVLREAAAAEHAEHVRGASDSGDTGAGSEQSGDFPSDLWPFALQNFAWMAWTDHAVVPALNDAPGVRLYQDSARIAVFTIGPASRDRLTLVSDLRRDNLCGLASDPSNETLLAEKKLRFGVLQGALEREALAAMVSAAGGDSSTVETTSSHVANGPFLVFAPGASRPNGHDRLNSESAARISASLAEGSTVVMPVSAHLATNSWWEISAGTGDTRATGELGLHMGLGSMPKNPLRTVKGYKGAQQNLFDAPKAFETEAARAERIREARQVAYEARREMFAQRARLNIGQMQPPRTASTSTGYTILLIIGGIIKEAVITAVVMWSIVQLTLSVQEFLATYGRE